MKVLESVYVTSTVMVVSDVCQIRGQNRRHLSWNKERCAILLMYYVNYFVNKKREITVHFL